MKGHIRERSPGVWRLYVDADPHPITRARQQRTRTFHGTRKQAETALARFIVETEATSLERAVKITVTALIEAWYAHVRHDLEPNTTRGYRSKIDHHITPNIGDRQIAKIAARDLNNLYDHLRTKGYAANTILGVHRILHTAFAYAVDVEWLDRNPAARATKPRPELEEPADLDPTLVAKIIAAAPDGITRNEAGKLEPPLRTIALLAAITGAREAELCGLRWTDLDVRARTLQIRRRVVYIKGGYVVRPLTKTKKPRTVGLDRRTVARLRILRWQCGQRARACGAQLPKDAFIFSELPDGTPLVPNVVASRWQRHRQKMGTTLTFHQLRHAHASFLLDAGAELSRVSKRLGHARQSTTSDVYSHIVKTSDHDLAETIAKNFR